jgi:hypothetical protein
MDSPEEFETERMRIVPDAPAISCNHRQFNLHKKGQIGAGTTALLEKAKAAPIRKRPWRGV